jgi:hypothetical protein
MKLMLKNVQKKQQDATNLPACSQAITTPSSRDLLLGKRWEQIAASPLTSNNVMHSIFLENNSFTCGS